jgi:putative peptidoglycan lipid II flippase
MEYHNPLPLATEDSTLKKTEEKQSVVKSALKMSLGTLSSRVLGMIRDSLVAALFERTVTDAFIVAFRIPNFFRRLISEGSLNVSFVPVFIDQINGEGEEEERRRRAMKLANSVFTLLTLISGTLSVLGVIFMDRLMDLLVGSQEFAGIPGKLELTVFLARIMFIYLYLVTSYSFLSAVANAMRAFFLPALAPAVWNLCVIIAAILPEPFGFRAGTGIAIGTVVGGLVQLAMVAWQLWKLGALPRLSVQIRVPGISLVLKNMLPGLIGLGILQVISFINVRYGAQLPEGTHTYLYYGDRLLELPQSLLAISLGTALLPSLSELLALNKKDRMLEMAAKYMRLLLFLALPSSVGLYVLAGPIVEVLFGRGEFGPADIAATASVIQIYSLLLLASSFTKVIVPSFYALKDTRTPAIVSVFVVIIHVSLAPYLMSFMGLQGLAWSTTVSGFSNMAMLLAVYRRKVGDLFIRRLFVCVGKCLPALIGLSLAAFYSYQGLMSLKDLVHGGWIGQIYKALALTLAILIAAAVYFIMSKLLKIEEAELFLQTFQRRWNRKKA